MEGRVAAVIGRVARSAAGRPATWLSVLAVITIALGAGLPRLTTEVDLLDILPDGDPNTEAARRLQVEFGAAYSQHVNMDVRIDPARCQADSDRLLEARQTEVRCGNITDEVYVRAMDEMQEFFLAHPDTPFEYVIGAHSFFRLLNWTAEGGADAPMEAFALPPRDTAGEVRYRTLEETGFRTVPESIMTPMGQGGVSYNVAFIPREGQTNHAVGAAAIHVLADYVAAVDAGRTTWTVFGGDNAPTYYTELAVADAHSAELVQRDLELLGPVLFAFLAVALAAAHRSLRGAAIAAIAILVSGVWAFGAMGWLGVPLGTFNLAVAPLLLGVGIDMAIHLLTAMQSGLRRGLPLVEAAERSGREAGFAMLIATVTTIFGLLVLALGPSPLIRQLGGVAALAIASVFVATLVAVPALVACFGNAKALGAAFRPNRALPAMARRISRRPAPWVAAGIVVGLVGGVGAMALEPEPFGEFALNYPEGDPYRETHQDNLETFYGTAPGDPLFIGNALVVEGDMVDPAVHDYIRRVADALRQADHVAPGTITHLPFLVEQYDAVRNGLPGAAAVIGQDTLLPLVGQERESADSREKIQEVLDEMLASPMAHFAALFVSPDARTSIITLSTQTGDLDAVEASWDSVWAAIDRAGPAPNETTVAFVGSTATNHLFVEEQLPFVAWLSAASIAGVTVLVAAGTRNLRAAAATAAIMGLTTAIWLGLLHLLGIGLSIYLVVPLVFISAIGSDAVVHLVLAVQRVGRDRAFGTVGKAVLFGALTDAGAFAVFAFSSDLAVRDTMIAAALAVTVAFVVATAGIAVAANRFEGGVHARHG